MTEERTNEPESDDGTVLSPDELDISDEENVVKLEDGRYVISPGDKTPNVSTVDRSAAGVVDRSPSDSNPEKSPPRTAVDPSRPASLDAEAVHAWLRRRFESSDSTYGFDVTAQFEGDVRQRSLFSNDVVTTFESLLVWYATNAGGDTPVEDVLGILLTESNLTIRFPPETFRAFVASYGLDETASIVDLYAAIYENSGVRFPPADR